MTRGLDGLRLIAGESTRVNGLLRGPVPIPLFDTIFADPGDAAREMYMKFALEVPGKKVQVLRAPLSVLDEKLPEILRFAKCGTLYFYPTVIDAANRFLGSRCLWAQLRKNLHSKIENSILECPYRPNYVIEDADRAYCFWIMDRFVDESWVVDTKNKILTELIGGEMPDARWSSGRSPVPIAECKVADLGGSPLSPDSIRRPLRRATASVTLQDLIVPMSDLRKKQLQKPLWAIEEILPEGLCVLAGRPKFGKSFLALQMALSVSTGTPFLRQFKTTKGQVLYVILEDSEWGVQDREKAMSIGEETADLHLAFSWPRMDAGGLGMLEQWLDANSERRLVILDTWALVEPEKSSRNAYQQDYAATAQMHSLAKKHHVAILLITHFRQPQRGNGSEDFMDCVMGTTGIIAAPDLVMGLRKKDEKAKDAVLMGRGRMGQFNDLSLRQEKGGAWALEGAPVGEKKERPNAILEILAAATEPMRPAEVAEALGKPVDSVRQQLWRLANEKRCIRKNGWFSK